MKIIIADNQYVTRLGIISLIESTFHDDVKPIVADTVPSLSAQLAEGGDEVCAVIVDCIGSDRDNINPFAIEDVQELASQYTHIVWMLFANEIFESVARRLASESHFSFLLKNAHSEEMVLALRLAATGERFICHDITNMLLNAPHSTTLDELTETEIEILKLTAQGKSVKEIAYDRNSSYHTINTHKRNIFRKLGINTSYEATRYAMRAGLVDLVEYYI